MFVLIGARDEQRRGFTLVELLVVIAIIGVLVSLLLPAVQAAREAARRIQCANRIKQCALAMHAYHDSDESLPVGSEFYSQDGTPNSTAMLSILPQLEQQTLYDLFHLDQLMSHPLNTPAVTTPIPQLTCPSDPLSSEPILSGRFTGTTGNPPVCHGLWYAPSMGPAHDRYPGLRPCIYCDAVTSFNPWTDAKFVYCCHGYYMGAGQFNTQPGVFPGMFARAAFSVKFSDVTDGLSHSLMMGETLPGHSTLNGMYMQNFALCPTHIPINTMMSDNGEDSVGPGGSGWWQHTMGFKSLHPGGANFAMGDASVRFISETVDYRTYNAMGTIAGDEVIATTE